MTTGTRRPTVGTSAAVAAALLVIASLVAPAAAATGPGVATAPESVTPDCTEGDVFLVGGGSDEYDDPGTVGERLFDRVLASVGGPENATVAIVPAGSSGPATAGDGWADDFTDAGVPADSVQVLPLATEDDPDTPENESRWIDNRDDPGVVETVEESNVVWFSGGAQVRHLRVLRANGTRTPVGAAIRRAHDCRGATVGGSSAGAAIAGEYTHSNGDSYGAMVDGVSPTNRYGVGEYTVWKTAGAGFLDVGIVDTHFHARARLARLARAMVHENASRNVSAQDLGFGIGENTMLAFEGNATRATVYGEFGVTVLDASNATLRELERDEGATEIRGLAVHYLTAGDRVEFGDDLRVVPNDSKTVDTDADPYYATGERVTGWVQNAAPHVEPWESADGEGLPAVRPTVRLLTVELLDNEASRAVGTETGDGTDYAAEGDRTVALYYYQRPDSQGYYDPGAERYAATNVTLDIVDPDAGGYRPRVASAVVDDAGRIRVSFDRPVEGADDGSLDRDDVAAVVVDGAVHRRGFEVSGDSRLTGTVTLDQRGDLAWWPDDGWDPGTNVSVRFEPVHPRSAGDPRPAGPVEVRTDTTPPDADAGPNRTIREGGRVTLDAANSTDDGSIATYQWDLDGDGEYEATGHTLRLGVDAPGSLTVGLRVTDAAGNAATDSVTVWIRPVPEPVERADLDGDGRIDDEELAAAVDRFRAGDLPRWALEEVIDAWSDRR